VGFPGRPEQKAQRGKEKKPGKKTEEYRRSGSQGTSKPKKKKQGGRETYGRRLGDDLPYPIDVISVLWYQGKGKEIGGMRVKRNRRRAQQEGSQSRGDAEKKMERGTPSIRSVSASSSNLTIGCPSERGREKKRSKRKGEKIPYLHPSILGRFKEEKGRKEKWL